jgi:hypothetical protein
MEEERLKSVGARQGNRWFCPSCLDGRFTPFIADLVDRERRVVELDLVAVDEDDPWVQTQVCFECHEPYDLEDPRWLELPCK